MKRGKFLGMLAVTPLYGLVPLECARCEEPEPCRVCLGCGEIDDHPLDGEFDWAKVTRVPCPRCSQSEQESAEYFASGKKLIFWDKSQHKWVPESEWLT